MKKIIVVKVGSQSIVQENGDLFLPQLENLISQIIEVEKLGFRVVLVSSGAVAAGRKLVQHRKVAFRNPIQERQVLASLGQGTLIHIYNEILKKHHYAAAQILITRDDFRSRNHYLNIQRLLDGLLNTPHLLPIINENDSTSIQELMFTDNDELSSLVAMLIDASTLIILTSVEGIYNADPKEFNAKIIHELHLDNESDWPLITTADKTVYGRGGMMSKIASAKRAAQAGIKTHIANAHAPNILLRLIHLKEAALGTTVLGTQKIRGIKKWLSYAQQVTASVIVNPPMAAIFKERKQVVSLLPIGILKIDGSFGKGDVVSIKDEANQVLGIGLAEYNSEALQEKLGKKNEKHFMHYNKIYIYGN